MKRIILDLGISKIYFDGRFYRAKETGRTVSIISNSTGQEWKFTFSQKSVSAEELRYWVKEEEPPKMRLLPKTQAKTHAN